MELRHVETFRAVAKELSFSRAAFNLGYVQSSVSAQIAALERDLGLPLFDRLGRSIRLTDAGQVMFFYAGRLLDLAEEARTSVSEVGLKAGVVTGTLTVSAPETLLTYRLPRLLAEFHRRYPMVRLSVRPSVVGRLTGGTQRAIEEGRVDVAFVLDHELEESLGFTGLVVEPLVGEAITVIAPAGHPLTGVSSVEPGHLASKAVLLPEAPEAGCAYRGVFERQLADARVIPAETIEFTSIEAVKQCVAAGMGISVLPTVTVSADLATSRLVALDWNGEFRVQTQVAYHADRWKSPAFAAFLKTTREVFGIAAG
ncbi:MAG: LysR family transcriptional regulator [Chloroflexia bacterium]|nr:LysR family transcriptional regulator [Chloroflexia bacterium]MDQ3524682.1 LysR family transcriptional regulator [Chloroflexota bacterium]